MVRYAARLLAIFLVIVLVPAALLVISGWRLMRHEEVVAAQQLRSHREQMADGSDFELFRVPRAAVLRNALD